MPDYPKYLDYAQTETRFEQMRNTNARCWALEAASRASQPASTCGTGPQSAAAAAAAADSANESSVLIS